MTAKFTFKLYDIILDLSLLIVCVNTWKGTILDLTMLGINAGVTGQTEDVSEEGSKRSVIERLLHLKLACFDI